MAANTIPCDANSLAGAASCLDCGISYGLQQAIIIYLLCQIANNQGSGGGGGNGQMVLYTSGTPANPPNVANPAIAYDPTGVLPMLGWNPANSTWN